MGTGYTLDAVDDGYYMWVVIGRGMFTTTTSSETTTMETVSFEISEYETYGDYQFGDILGYNFADLYGSTYSDSDSAMDACVADEE